MKKSILQLKNVQELNKAEQKSILGGNDLCPNNPRGMCPVGLTFNWGTCTCELLCPECVEG